MSDNAWDCARCDGGAIALINGYCESCYKEVQVEKQRHDAELERAGIRMMLRGAGLMAVICLTTLTGCALTKEDRRGLDVAAEHVENLRADAHRNRAARAALAAYLADSTVHATLDRAARAQGGTISADFAKALIALRLELDAKLRDIDSAEAANIKGNADAARRLIGEIVENAARRQKLEADDMAVIGSTVTSVVEGYLEREAAKAAAKAAAAAREGEGD